MSEHDLEALAALQAIGASTPDEDAALAALLARDPDAVREVRAFADAGALLAHELPPIAPPAGALDRIRQAIQAEPAPTRERAGGDVIDLASRRRRTSTYVAATSLLAAAAMLALWLRSQSTANDLRSSLADASETEQSLRQALSQTRRRELQLRDQLTAVNSQLDQANGRVQFVSEPALSLSTIQKDQTTVKIFIDPDRRRWLVFAHELPPVSDRDYQLWFISPNAKAPVSAGLLKMRSDGTLEAEIDLPDDLDDIQQAAISLEKKGGSPVPTLDQIKIIGTI